jgi:hypothetical protein
MSKVDPYLYEDILEKEMHTYKQEALRKVSTVVAHQHAEKFAKILHYSWQEGLPEAENLTHLLDLAPIDFIAIIEDLTEFEKLLIQEREILYG